MSFEAAVESTGGDNATLAKAFALAVKGIARSWYSVLPPGSIYSWEQLRNALYSNFQGNRADKITTSDFFALKQQPTKTLQSYMHRFVHIRYQAKGL